MTAGPDHFIQHLLIELGILGCRGFWVCLAQGQEPSPAPVGNVLQGAFMRIRRGCPAFLFLPNPQIESAKTEKALAV